MSAAQVIGTVVVGVVLYSCVAGGIWRLIRLPPVTGRCGCNGLTGWTCAAHRRRDGRMAIAVLWPLSGVAFIASKVVVALVVAPFRLVAGLNRRNVGAKR